MTAIHELLLGNLQTGQYRVDFEVPYYSQFTTPNLGPLIISGQLPSSSDKRWKEFGAETIEEYEFWSRRACAIVSLRMALEAYGRNVSNTMALINEGLELGGYDRYDNEGRLIDIGWYHVPLVQLARKYGLEGIVRNTVSLDDICVSILISHLVIASVSIRISGIPISGSIQSSGGHMIVVLGFEWIENKGCQNLIIHNPLGKDASLRENAKIPSNQFLDSFSGRIIEFWDQLSPEEVYSHTIARKTPYNDKKIEEGVIRGGIVSESTSNGTSVYLSDLDKFMREKREAESNYDEEKKAWASRNLAETYRRLGRYEDALIEYRNANNLFAQNSNLVGQGWSNWGLASIDRMKGDYKSSSEYYTQSLEMFMLAKDELGVAGAQAGLAEIERFLGDPSLALQRHFSLKETFDRLGEKRGLLWAYTGIGQIAFTIGRYSLAAHSFRKAFEIALEMGYLVGSGWCIIGLSDVARVLMDTEYATKLAKVGQQIFQYAGYPIGILYANLNSADVLRLQGQYEEALQVIENPEVSFGALGKVRGAAYSNLARASNLKLLGQYEIAIRMYEKALNEFQRNEVRLGVIKSRLGISDTTRCLGDFALAADQFANVAQLAKKWGYPIEGLHAELGFIASMYRKGKPEKQSSNAYIDRLTKLISNYYNSGLMWGVFHGYLQKAIFASSSKTKKKWLFVAKKGALQLNYKNGIELIGRVINENELLFPLDFP